MFRWYVLGALAAAAIVCGIVGMSEYLPTLTQPQAGGKHHPTWSDVVYNTLRLFVLDGPDMNHGVPPALDVARFLAPIVFGSAGLAAISAVFQERLQQMRIPFMRRHVVVCGLGYVGSVFVRNLLEAGERVVVVESDPANSNLEMCRRSGIPVVIGDAQMERVLEAAGVEHAARVLAVTDWDAVNAEIVCNASKVASNRVGPKIFCLARIEDPDLCQVIRVEEAGRQGSSVHLDFFNTDDVCARLLVRAFGITDARCQPHVLVAHLDGLGAALVKHLAWQWFSMCDAQITAKLRVSVVDDDAVNRIARLTAIHPALAHVCEFVSYTYSLIGSGALKDELDAEVPLQRAYVTAFRDEIGMETALRLRHELDDGQLVLALSRAHGVARLVADAQANGLRSGISVFQTLDQACSVDLARGGSFEAIAEAIHTNYCETKKKNDPAAEPVDWVRLDVVLKDSNRAQARDIPRKLAMIGKEIAPLRDWAAQPAVFDSGDVERLAADEHDRWYRERRRAKPGQEAGRYPERFEDMDILAQEYDRDAVRAIPAVLRLVGLDVRDRATGRLSEDAVGNG